jgi:hypothetical protein
MYARIWASIARLLNGFARFANNKGEYFKKVTGYRWFLQLKWSHPKGNERGQSDGKSDNGRCG